MVRSPEYSKKPYLIGSIYLLVRKQLPKYSKSALTATKILAQRSAVPAVFARTTSSTPLKRKKISHEEKERLLRIAKRPRRGPFNAVMDHTEVGAGSALLELSEAAKSSGQYDVWGQPEEVIEDIVDAVTDKKAKVKVSLLLVKVLVYLFSLMVVFSLPRPLRPPTLGRKFCYRLCLRLMREHHIIHL